MIPMCVRMLNLCVESSEALAHSTEVNSSGDVIFQVEERGILRNAHKNEHRCPARLRIRVRLLVLIQMSRLM